MGYNAVIFLDKPIDDNLKCAICFNVCEDATTACNSGHTFCAKCLSVNEKQGAKKTCPTCRGDRINAPNRPLRGMIDGLRVCCGEGKDIDDSGDGAPEKKKSRTEGNTAENKPNENGCNWEGKLGDWRDTHRKECLFVDILCPNKCGEQMRRMDVDEHKKECSRIRVECELCNEMVSHSYLPYHEKANCPKALVKCEYCDEEMTREERGTKGYPQKEKFPDLKKTSNFDSDHTGHYTVCPKMILQCEFHSRGCRTEFKREDAAAYHAENAQYHAALVNETFNRLYTWLDWDYVQMSWYIPKTKLVGWQNKVLQSQKLSGVSQYDLYLKLYLYGPDAPIKVAICSDPFEYAPVSGHASLKKIEMKVTKNGGHPHLATRYAIFYHEEEKMVEYQGGSGAFEFRSTLKRCDNEEEEGKLNYNRSDFSASMDRHELDGVSIRACFCIKKENSVYLRCV